MKSRSEQKDQKLAPSLHTQIRSHRFLKAVSDVCNFYVETEQKVIQIDKLMDYIKHTEKSLDYYKELDEISNQGKGIDCYFKQMKSLEYLTDIVKRQKELTEKARELSKLCDNFLSIESEESLLYSRKQEGNIFFNAKDKSVKASIPAVKIIPIIHESPKSP